jgi:hypothetical protein
MYVVALMLKPLETVKLYKEAVIIHPNLNEVRSNVSVKAYNE